jgi:hypothetical protein
MKVSDFWLPAYNHSVTAIRLGGQAELTIDYNDYEIMGASRVSSLSVPQSNPHVENRSCAKVMPAQTAMRSPLRS